MSSMYIAIDGNEANVAHRVGSNVYAFEVLQALERLTRRRPELVFTIVLAAPATKELPKSRKNWNYLVIGPKTLWTQFALPIHLFLHRKSYDVLYTPGHYAPRLSSVPYVSSVMDLAFLLYPDQFKHTDLIQLTDWTAYSVKHAKKVIAISEFTKHDVIAKYHRDPSDVVVAYPAVTPPTHFVLPNRAKAVFRKYAIKQPYFLYVGTLQPRKNIVALIEAFEHVCREMSHRHYATTLRRKFELQKNDTVRMQLVLAGKIGWLADDIVARAKNSPFADQIIMTGYVDDYAKRVLYEGAAAVTLVGLYEGFGIPPLEALLYGAVPVVSKTSSLPEAVGKAGILVDPSDPKDIARGLQEAVMLSAKEKSRLHKEARVQLQKFSWQTTAETILLTILEVGKK